jgi:hypothetical protein
MTIEIIQIIEFVMTVDLLNLTSTLPQAYLEEQKIGVFINSRGLTYSLPNKIIDSSQNKPNF